MVRRLQLEPSVIQCFECTRLASSGEPSTRRFPVKTGQHPRRGRVASGAGQRRGSFAHVHSAVGIHQHQEQYEWQCGYRIVSQQQQQRHTARTMVARSRRNEQSDAGTVPDRVRLWLRPRLLVGDAVREGWIGRRALRQRWNVARSLLEGMPAPSERRGKIDHALGERVDLRHRAHFRRVHRPHDEACRPRRPSRSATSSS